MAIPVAVPLIAIGVFVVRGSDTGTFPDIHAPQTGGTTTVPPPPTAPVDLTGISIPGVAGTTTTAPVRSLGTAHLAGLVSGPDGPVAGAVVRLEHLVGDAVTTDVVAGPDGHYDAPNIAGGRYRVRAFLAPTFAQAEPEVFFLNDGDLRGLDLSVRSYGGLALASATAPDPPVRDDPATFVVRVANRTVDSGGIVRVRPVPDASVQVIGATGWSVSGPAAAVTDANGDVSFTLVCTTPGANQVQVQVQRTAADAPQPAALTTPTCIDRPPPPTTPAGPSSAPPSSGSSASSGSSPPPAPN
ncbi:MAG TPA: carboxypeptidase-like regulatory domain-containing protein [Acidimicrobiales bacterium]|jgi:hypothetical protein|nr:carboxypeptidase-like regulatory domain-containing protein [Acidimicrobiales bacterium]